APSAAAHVERAAAELGAGAGDGALHVAGGHRAAGGEGDERVRRLRVDGAAVRERKVEREERRAAGAIDDAGVAERVRHAAGLRAARTGDVQRAGRLVVEVAGTGEGDGEGRVVVDRAAVVEGVQVQREVAGERSEVAGRAGV